MNKRFLMLVLLMPLIARTETMTFQMQEDYSVVPNVKNIIDADAGSVFGVKPFSTVSEVVATLGNPSGVIRIDEFRTGLIYGNSCMFIFRKGKFQEFLRAERMFSGPYLTLEVHPLFDRPNWVLKADGKEIRDRMKPQEINPDQTSPGASINIITDTFSVALTFSSYPGPEPRTYTLYGMDIKFTAPLPAAAPAP